MFPAMDRFEWPDALGKPVIPLVMGILNATPDSFSDGGQHNTTDLAIAHGLKLLDDGADILDIGGESTRPGADDVNVETETERVVPVIEGILAQRPNAIISVDTTKAQVAERALAVGAVIVNDVTAGTLEPEILDVAASNNAWVCLMHMKGTPRTMQDNPEYSDVVGEVRAYLEGRVEAAFDAGLSPQRVWIDPGFGFGKLPEHNFALVRDLVAFVSLGYPVLLGVSRKSSLGSITGRPVNDREPETLSASLLGALNGAAILRVHEPDALKRALMTAHAMGA